MQAMKSHEIRSKLHAPIYISSTNKTERRDIAEILLEVAFNITILILTLVQLSV